MSGSCARVITSKRAPRSSDPPLLPPPAAAPGQARGAGSALPPGATRFRTGPRDDARVRARPGGGAGRPGAAAGGGERDAGALLAAGDAAGDGDVVRAERAQDVLRLRYDGRRERAS